MADYAFFVAHLRFVAAKTEASTPEIAEMVAELDRIAEQVAATGALSIAPDRLRVAARGLAGLAGFLQDLILPEVVAAGNRAGERQVRWVIDTSMALMTKLTARAELGGPEEPFVLPLPPPPGAS